ncbi:hypothetical protein KY386_03330 [Candidatus Parcubacteria bacterium]|nr:hypothetical protein [Candidatus Parcubacteria bacterium]
MKTWRIVAVCLFVIGTVILATFFTRQDSSADSCPAQDTCTRQLGELQGHLFKPVQAYGSWLGAQLHQVRSPEPNAAERAITNAVVKRQAGLLETVNWRMIVGIGFALIVLLCVLSKQLTTNLWRRCGIILAVVFMIATAGFPKSGLVLKTVANPATYIKDLPVRAENAFVQSPHAIMQFGNFGRTDLGQGYANRLLEGGSLTKSERDQASSPSGIRQATLTAPAALLNILSVGPIMAALAFMGQASDAVIQLGWVLLPLALVLYWFDGTRRWFWRFARGMLALWAVMALSGAALAAVSLAYAWLYDNFTSQGWLGEATNLVAGLGAGILLLKHRGRLLKRVLTPFVAFTVGLWRFIMHGWRRPSADQQPALERGKFIDVPSQPVLEQTRRIALRR